MPALNDIHAIQAGGQLSVNSPIRDWLTISVTEEDDFINNAPKAKRKNYSKSSLTLKYTFPPPPPAPH
jgi:hypothetical protein